MECESCFENTAEVEGIVEHAHMHLCRKCALIDGAVLIQKPTKVNIDDSYKRSTVKEVLMRMSGVERPKISKKNPHLDDLRIVKKKLEEEDKKFDEEIKVITEDNSQESKKWSFSNFFPFFGKEKKPDASKGPSVEDNQEARDMRLRNVRKEAQADEGVLDL